MPTRAIRQDQEINEIEIGKVEVNFSPFIDDLIPKRP
jgi:hypothetical protein